jgi:hypothetical protein
MAYTVTKLITNAYYLSGVVRRRLGTVSGQQLADGLDLLNDLLAIKTANNRLIPYFTHYSFDTVVGQESYLIPNLISIEALTFNLGDVRFPTSNMSRKGYFGSPRVNGVQSLPFVRHSEREKGGTRIFLYFNPNAIYPVNLWGKFGLTSVTKSTDLSLTYERFYIAYLRYALGREICADYNITYQPQNDQRLKEIEQMITDISPIDLTSTKISLFQKDGGLNWGLVNFPGWVP